MPGVWPRLDALVNNAGVGPTVRGDLLDATIDSFDRVRAINPRGPGLLTQAFARAVMGHGPDAAAGLNLPDAFRFTPDGGALDAQVQGGGGRPGPGPGRAGRGHLAPGASHPGRRRLLRKRLARVPH